MFSGVQFTIERGERTLLVGPNGAGKSTLIRLLAAMDNPTSRSASTGPQRRAAVFRPGPIQGAPRLTPRMLDDIGRSAPENPANRITKPARDASSSPGDATSSSNLACFPAANGTATPWLACSSVRQIFFYWMSPQTTSTCAPKKSCWKQSRNFTGTVALVSHDRAFIDALATRVFEIRDGAVHVYTGNYEDYLVADIAPGRNSVENSPRLPM